MSEGDQDKQQKLEEYKILVDLLKHQHTRISSYSTMSLAIHTVWVVLVGSSIQKYPDDPELTMILAVVGFSLCVVWFLGLCRLRLDDKRLVWQLRDRERKYEVGSIYLEGWRFFADGKPLLTCHADGRQDHLEFPSKPWCPSRFRLYWVGICWAVIFSGLYVFAFLKVIPSDSLPSIIAGMYVVAVFVILWFLRK